MFAVMGLIVAVVAVGIVAVMGGMLTPAAGTIIQQQESQEDFADAISEIADAGVCDEDGHGELRAAIYNELNESGAEYLAATGRLYEVSAADVET